MTSYDEVPYPIYSHSQTHPAELATLALLHGLQPTPVTGCRVLEIGCAQGGNLIPIACSLPDSDCVGIDMSPRQIAEGQAFVNRLDLKNVRLLALDLMKLDESFGQFDYIIAHGFYSWVPPAVRERLFEVCKKHLTPRGVAYISYNAYPGWRAMSAIRDILLYRVKDVAGPLRQAELAREMLNLLSNSATQNRTTLSNLTQAHADFLTVMHKNTQPGDESYFLHDILEEYNEPVYFSDFAAQLQRHGLQFLADTDFRASLTSNLTPEAAQRLGEMARDRIDWEQYCDFFSNRMFRQNLVCHAGFEAKFKLSVEALQAFRFGSVARVEGAVNPEEKVVEKFVSHDKASLSTDHPVSRAAIHYLMETWPRTSTFAELLAAARRRLNLNGQDAAAINLDAQMLASNLLNAYTHSDQLIAFTVFEPHFVDALSECPIASPWARLQAERATTITTLRHGRYKLEPYEQFLIRSLDGKHNLESMIAELESGPVASGDLTLEKENQIVTDPVELRQLLRDGVEKTLTAFAAAPLLIA